MTRRARALDKKRAVGQHRRMQTVTYSDAKRNLNAVIDKAISDRAPVRISQRSGPSVVLMSADDWETINSVIKRP